jgi:preprotein translocase subunit SecG
MIVTSVLAGLFFITTISLSIYVYRKYRKRKNSLKEEKRRSLKAADPVTLKVVTPHYPTTQPSEPDDHDYDNFHEDND